MYTQSLLDSFDRLPAALKYQVAIDILRRLDAGEAIENAIRALQEKWPSEPTYPLRGTPVKLEDPFGPATPHEDWSVLS
jgi:hypothetical protein